MGRRAWVVEEGAYYTRSRVGAEGAKSRRKLPWTHTWAGGHGL
jgi:hypothetical protein